MTDLAGKYITTENNTESSKILKMAIAQGYRTQKGEKALEGCRIFHFVSHPYMYITTPTTVKTSDLDNAVRYSDLFGDEKEELTKIVDSATRWCKTHGYEHLGIYINDEGKEFTGHGIANSKDGIRQEVSVVIRKPCKVTIEEIEERFGYPIEIVS